MTMNYKTSFSILMPVISSSERRYRDIISDKCLKLLYNTANICTYVLKKSLRNDTGRGVHWCFVSETQRFSVCDSNTHSQTSIYTPVPSNNRGASCCTLLLWTVINSTVYHSVYDGLCMYFKDTNMNE